MQDYCTLWPDSLFNRNWSHCCKQHDVAYDLGVDRALADDVLAACVAQVTNWPWFAFVMFCGVSVFGRVAWHRAKKKRLKQAASST